MDWITLVLVGTVLLTLVVIIFILGYLFVAVRTALKRTPAQGEKQRPGLPMAAAAEAEAEKQTMPVRPMQVASSRTLRDSFAHAVKLLKAHVSARNYRYQIPWFLMLGEAASGKTTLLDNSGLSLPLGRPAAEGLAGAQGCNWWFFDEGIVLDVAGDYILRADGTGSDDKGRAALLRLLLKYRPERPIDGVILTVPCTDLIGPARLSEERLTTAKKKAEQLYQRLWQIQKTLGVCVPVYVLVTKCDQIAGFRSFCQAIPARLHADMFGWSNPYALEAAYVTGWVDEAFESLQDHLYETYLEAVAEASDLRDPDGLFLFRSEFQSIEEPLRAYLNQLFKPSVYHEAFFLRGVYFSGDAQATEGSQQQAVSASEAPLLPSEPPKPVFVKNLLAKKIFPEWALARPAPKAFLSRNRATVAAQVAIVLVVLVGGVGLWKGYGWLSREKAPVLNALKQIERILPEAHAKRYVDDWEWLKHNTEDLLKSLPAIGPKSLRSVFFPSSWLSPLHDDIKASIETAYQQIIMISMRKELIQEAAKISKEGEGTYSKIKTACAPEADHPAGLDVERMADCAGLIPYIDKVAEFDANVALFDALGEPGKTPSLFKLSELVQYVYPSITGLSLPSEATGAYYRAALKQACAKRFMQERSGSRRGCAEPTANDEKRVETQTDALIDTLERLANGFYAQLFERNELLVRLRDVSERIERLEGGEPAPKRSEAALRLLSEALNRTERLLTDSQSAWVVGDSFKDWEPFKNKIVGPIRAIKFLPPDRVKAVADEIDNKGEAKFGDFKRKLKTELATQEGKLSGPILQEKDGQIQLAFAPRVSAIDQALDELFSQSFMAQKGPREAIFADFSPRPHLLWDKQALNEALQSYENAKAFLEQKFEAVPPANRRAIAEASGFHLGITMFDQAMQGVTVQQMPTRVPTEQGLRLEITSFKEASPLISRLLVLFNHLGSQPSYQVLLDLTSSQAYEGLRNVDRLLATEGLYQVKRGNFDWWDGQEPLAFAAFDIESMKGLNMYLDIQRGRVAYVAREYAKPLVEFLSKEAVYQQLRGARRLLVSKWQGTLADLEDYGNKKPGNAVANLETFILAGMSQIDLSNCLEKVAPRDGADQGGEFFVHRLNGLRRNLYGRCLVLAGDKTLRGYAQVEQFFNQRLARRFPFADHAGNGGTEAEPVAIRDFYRLFDEYMETGKDLLKRGTGFGITRDQALEFLDQMAAVRRLFAPFLGRERKFQEPTYDVSVAFRVNRRKEQGGDQIIDWVLVVGDQTLRRPVGQKQARWRFGDPIRVSLRWAKDAPQRPVGVENRQQATVQDRSVIYEYRNQWSLISLVEDHLGVPADFDGFVDPKPYTLRFQIKAEGGMIPDQSTDGQAGPSETKVFIRVTILSPDTKEELVLPKFPTKAPQLSRAPKNGKKA